VFSLDLSHISENCCATVTSYAEINQRFNHEEAEQTKFRR
jgi:hypothetical protein